MTTIGEIVQVLGDRGCRLSLSQLVAFISVSRIIRKQILLVYESSHRPEDIPPLLPPEPRVLLAKTCGLSEEDVKTCWEAVGTLVWKPDEMLESVKDDSSVHNLFRSAEHPFFREYPVCRCLLEINVAYSLSPKHMASSGHLLLRRVSLCSCQQATQVARSIGTERRLVYSFGGCHCGKIFPYYM
jgi:hypothetical protein